MGGGEVLEKVFHAVDPAVASGCSQGAGFGFGLRGEISYNLRAGPRDYLLL